MPYQIDKTDGTVLVTLADGVVDTSTDLNLVGRNVAGYGEQQNENFVKLLENFARADTPPSKALIGQIWFDKNADKMRPSVFDGVQWRNLSITQVQSTQPNNQKEGDLWWDTINDKLYVWQANGNQHILVGPESITGYGKTRWSSQILTDTTGTDHPCSVGYIDDAPYMVLADTAFEIDQTKTPLTGFTRIGEGITAKGTSVDGITSSTTRFFGTATDSERLGGRLASTWANRNDNEIITGAWSFQNDTGITIGDTLELSLKVINGNQPAIFAEFNDTLHLGVNYAASGADKTVISLNQKSIVPYADNQVNLGLPTKKFRNIYADGIFANMVGDAIGTFQGTLTGSVNGNVVGNVTGTVTGPTIGTVSSSGGKIIVNNDQQITLTSAGRDGESGNYQGYFDGTAKYVIDGMYRTNNQTISGSKTFTSTQTFNAAVNVNHTLSADNVNITQGTIGTNGNVTLLQYSDLENSEIRTTTMYGGQIRSGTVIDGADIGLNSPAIQVKAQKFVDAVGTTILRFSTDGNFIQNSDDLLPTQKAIKTYVDKVFGATGQDIQFYLDTKDMTISDVQAQLTRLAPPANFKEGTKARILGSYYYSDYAGTGTFVERKKITVVPPGIGRIGGYTRRDVVEDMTNLINAKSATVGYEFQLSASGNTSSATATFNTNATSSNFTTQLAAGTLTGWFVFTDPLNSNQANQFPSGAVLGARIVVMTNGIVQNFATDASLLQLVTGNITLARTGGVVDDTTVALGGFATPVKFYNFTETTISSSASWIYKGSI